MKKIVAVSAILLSCFSTLSYAGIYLGASVLGQYTTGMKSSYTGIRPVFTVGMGDSVYNNYYLGAEIFGSPTSAKIANAHSTGYPSAKSTLEYGATILPGMKVNEEVLAYLRLGGVRAQFTGPNTYRSGVQAGVGAQTRLTDGLDIRIEYIYSEYKSISYLGRPRTSEAGVGLIYRFS